MVTIGIDGKPLDVGADTRNRWQRMYEARYEGKPFSEAEVREIRERRISECNTDKFERMSRTGMMTRYHPRTGEKTTMVTGEVIQPSIQPRVPYHRVMNASQQGIKATIKDGKITAIEIVNQTKQTATWKGVYYGSGGRRK